MARYLSEHGLETLWGDIEQYVGSQTEGTAESDGSTAGPIMRLTAEGHAEQDGTPTPDNPVEIQTVTGHEVTGKTGRYVDLVVKQGDTTLSTTPIPLPSRGWAAGLPDSTADTLTLDGAGKVTWVQRVGKITVDGSETWSGNVTTGWYSSLDTIKKLSGYKLLSDSMKTYLSNFSTYFYNANIGVTAFNDANNRYPNQNWLYIMNIDCADVTSFKSWLSTHPVTVLYPLATPVTEDMGYIDLPDIPEGASLSIAELDAIGVHYVVDDAAVTMARQWYERARAEYAVRIEQLETTVSYLMSRS
jgi:hypothetical protein